MDDENAQVGWTEAQWNRVREEVLRAWQRVRVAGSFLPAYGPLPPSTQVVPSEVFNPDGTVDDQATSVLLEIALPVTLTRQEVREEDLSSALLQFRRRASQVGQLEDWYIFNGTYPGSGVADQTTLTSIGDAKDPSRLYRPFSRYLDEVVAMEWPFLKGAPKPIANHETQLQGLRRRNPGALGLLEGATQDGQLGEKPTVQPLDNKGLTRAVVRAIDSLEQQGYVAPYVCVFGRDPFEAAHEPTDNSITFPRDRLEPLIGRELLHASALDIIPHEVDEYSQPDPRQWQARGMLLSLAGEAVDLAIAAEATPEFRYVDREGRYVFAVFERFTLRIKDTRAIVSLQFQPTRQTRQTRQTRPTRPTRPTRQPPTNA
jgi:uncharacterized linocin/CFP29 family protein